MISLVGKRNKMKLDKQTLKSIVKECLVEILAEGIVSNSNGSSTRKKRALTEAITSSDRRRSIEGYGNNQQFCSCTQNKSPRRSYLDNISFGGDTARSNQQDNAVSRITKSITKDALMQDILADTARTTLQEQRSGDAPRSTPAQISRPADKAAENS